MKWETVKLESLCSVITKGTTPSNIGETFTASGINYIRSEMLTSSKFISGEFLHISEETHSKLRRSQLHANDILFSMAGVYLGKTAILRPEDVPANTNQAVALVRVDEAKAIPEFVYYCLNIPQIVKLANTIQSQSAQPNINLKQIGNLEIPLPPIEEQEKTVDILAAYDDLIESNQKQIKLLEEAAQRLYKEWFIDLRFPGHESTPIHDGIPEGWERKSVEECLQMHINGGWGKESPEAKNCIPGRVIRGTDIKDVKAGNLNDIPLRYHTENDVSKRALRQGDIIFELSNGNLANIGRTLFVDDLLLQYCGNPTICASFCKLFRPVDRLHALMLYWEIQDMQASGRMLPYKKHGANGINNFDFEGFLKHKLLVPMSLEYVAPFDLVMQKESVIQHELMLLTEARDRLLPKLMSGEIEV